MNVHSDQGEQLLKVAQECNSNNDDDDGDNT